MIAQAKKEITNGAPNEIGGNGNLVQKLAERLGIAANSVKIFAEPIEYDGGIIVPVSKISYGFGGGFGKQTDQEGGGGGGGLTTSPAGYIEIKNGETKFRPIIDLQMLIPVITAGCLGLLTVFWGIGKLIRSSRQRAQI